METDRVDKAEKLDLSGVAKLADGTIALVVKDESTGNWQGFPIWGREYYFDTEGHCIQDRDKDIIECFKGRLKQPELPQKAV